MGGTGSKGITLPKQYIKNKKEVYIAVLEDWEVKEKLKDLI